MSKRFLIGTALLAVGAGAWFVGTRLRSASRPPANDLNTVFSLSASEDLDSYGTATGVTHACTATTRAEVFTDA